MRFFTILISVLVGVALCAVFLNNGHLVRVNFGPFFSGPAPAIHKTEPLWVVIFASASVGLAVGYFLGWSGSSGSTAQPQKPQRGDDDVDYLIGVKKG